MVMLIGLLDISVAFNIILVMTVTGRPAHSTAIPALFLLIGAKMGFLPHRGDTLPQ